MSTKTAHAMAPAGVFLTTPAGSGFALGYTAAPGRVVLGAVLVLVTALFAYAVVLAVRNRRRPAPARVVQVDPYAELRRQVAAACASIDRIGEHVAAGVAAELDAVNEARQAVASVTALTTDLDELRTALTPRDRKEATR